MLALSLCVEIEYDLSEEQYKQLDLFFNVFFLFRENIAVRLISVGFLSQNRTISSGDPFLLEFGVEIGNDFSCSFKMQIDQAFPLLLKSTFKCY